MTLSSTTSGATIRYTLDGSTPSETAGTIYTAPFVVSATTTVRAIAYAAGLTDSVVSSAVYTILAAAPTLASLSPASGTVGSSVILAGANFGATQGNSTVTFNGISAGSAASWSASTIVAMVPVGATAGNVVVTVGGVASNALSFTVTSSGPSITSLAPASGAVGAWVTIAGNNFGASQGTSTVTFNGASVGIATSWSASSITATVPFVATTGNVVVTVNGTMSNGMIFTVTGPPTVSAVLPATAVAGMPVTISGSGFGASQGNGLVWLGSTLGKVTSWSDTQVVATVASNATSGTAGVQQGGAWSNALTFNVNTAAITGVVPAGGPPGTVVTIFGLGFGATQGAGQVFIGGAGGVVESWSDTQIVAVVAPEAALAMAQMRSAARAAALSNARLGRKRMQSRQTGGSGSGSVLVLQNGVVSNSAPFTVDVLAISDVSPASGASGTPVTITGTGFGSSQGSGAVWIGGAAAPVASWSDTQIVATVAATSLTGVVLVEQNGAWSNGEGFTVPAVNGNTLQPALVNLMVGDTRTLQALNAANQPVTGLTWKTSDATVVSLSTDDPPLLTALAAGHVAITAGTASADVIVSAGALPVGTVLWSNPGDGSGVDWIVPAVPSPSGVDVFAFQGDGTVQAITSDGATAWTVDVGDLAGANPPYVHRLGGSEYPPPNFQGGLVGAGTTSVVVLDGMTGQRYPPYTVDPNQSYLMKDNGLARLSQNRR